MDFNPRIYIKALYNTLYKQNPIVCIILQFKKIISIYSLIPQKSKSLSINLHKNISKLEKTKSIINSASRQDRFNSINLIR